MENFPTFLEFLKAKNALNAMPEAKEQLQKQYKKLYQKEYDKKRRLSTRPVQIQLPVDEYERVTLEAKEYGLSRPKYILRAFRAYKEQSFVLSDEEVFYDITMVINKYGVLLNQIAFKCNSAGFASKKNVIEALQITQKMAQAIKDHLRPISFESYIAQEAKKNPMFLEHAESIILAHKNMQS